MHGELAPAGAYHGAGAGARILGALEDLLPASRALTAAERSAQRARQVELVLWHLTIRARFGQLWQQQMDDTVQVAVNMLRADPEASLLQQLHGRYV